MSVWCLMMKDVLFVDEQVILAATALMHSVTAGMNSATLLRIGSTRCLPQEHHSTKMGVILDHNTSTCEETDHIQPIIGTGMEYNSTSNSHANISTMTGAAAVTDDTHCAPHPVTTAACTFLLADGCPNCQSHHDMPQRHNCNPSQTYHFSPRCHLHNYSRDWSQSHFRNSHCTAWGTQPMRKAKSHPRPLTPTHATIPKLLSSRTPHQILPQIQTVTLIL